MEVITRNVTKPLTKFEVVETKGKGHPDNICDEMAFHISNEFAKDYERDYGVVQPHCIQRLNSIGGRVNTKYGGGEIVDCPGIIIKGFASTLSKDPMEICIKSIINYFVDTLEEYSEDIDVFCHFDEVIEPVPQIIGFGYSDTSELEFDVSNISKYLNNIDSIMGTDFHIKATRIKSKTEYDISYAVIDGELIDEIELNNFNDMIKTEIEEEFGKVKLTPYLTVVGSRFESKDGSIGNGNKENGLIVPLRPTGTNFNVPNCLKKRYDKLAFNLADKIRYNTDMEGVEVCIVNNPQIIHINGINAKKNDLLDAVEIAKEIYNKNVDNL